MGLFQKSAPALAFVWRRMPEAVQKSFLWAVNGGVLAGVSGVLLNDAGDVLLLSHRFHSNRQWGLPGGWLSPGETIFDCWRREVREETGLAIGIDGLLLHKATRNSLDFVLLGHIRGGELIIDPAEILDARFFRLDELPRLPSTQRRAIQQARTGQNILLRTGAKLPVFATGPGANDTQKIYG